MININKSTRDVCHIFFPKPKRTCCRSNHVLSEKLLFIQNFIRCQEFKILTVFPYIGAALNACLYHFNWERWRRKKAQHQSGFEPRYFNLRCDVEPAELLALPKVVTVGRFENKTKPSKNLPPSNLDPFLKWSYWNYSALSFLDSSFSCSMIKMWLNDNKLALVAQCCNLNRETLVKHRLLVWFNPDHWKGDRHYVGYLCKHSTSQPLYQGTGKCQKNETRRVACCCKMWSARSCIRFLRGLSAFHVINPAIMIVIIMCLFCASCVINHCRWELLTNTGVLETKTRQEV